MKTPKFRTTRLVMAAGLLALAPGMVLAGTGGTEFNPALAQLQGWIEGDLGRLIAIGLLIVGMAMGIVRQSVMAAVPAIATGLVLSLAPTVLNSIFTAVI